MKLKLDQRYKTTKTINRWFNKYTAAAGMWGFLIGALLSMYFSLEAKNRTPEALERKVIPQVVEVKADEKPESYYKEEPLRYIRYRGQQLGYTDFQITTFVKIAKCESGYKPMAKNPSSTATGIYQFIHGTFYHYCKGNNVYDFVDNIDCFYKVLETDGYPKALNHWNASKDCWNK